MPIPHKMKMALKRYRPKVQVQTKPDDVCSYADFIKSQSNPIQSFNPFEESYMVWSSGTNDIKEHQIYVSYELVDSFIQ